MVDFKENVKDSKTYLWEKLWFSFRAYIVIGVMCFISMLFFFLVAFFDDKEAFIYAFELLGLFIIIILFLVGVIIHYKKTLKNFFADANSEGNIELSISFDNDELVIENLSRKTVSKIRQREIKSVSTLGNAIFIKTTISEPFLLPKTRELLDFFEQNNFIK